jgi:hypothetical protein
VIYGRASSLVSQFRLNYERPFLLPRFKARLLRTFILLSLVGEVGLGTDSLPDRVVCELSDDWEVDLLRLSSARMSSKDTLR